MSIELPPGVEIDEPKAETPSEEQPIVTLTITFNESTGGVWANGPVGAVPLCSLMLKRVWMMPLSDIKSIPGEKGVHVLSIHWDRKNPDPVKAFSADLATVMQMSDLEGEMFIDWLCEHGKETIKKSAEIAAQKAQQQGVQIAPASMLTGLRQNGRMPPR